MNSIIIPAHNEERVIARCLATLCDGLSLGAFEVLVVCNGCKDRTAQIARGFAPVVRVIETAHASKWYALNLGDEAAAGDVRIYVDADVLVSGESIRQVAEALRSGPSLVVAPRVKFDTEGCSCAVKAFYRAWHSLPYFDQGMIGSGLYAVSAEGRRRWGRFPPIIADDGFVRRQFQLNERASLEDCEFVVFPPRRLRQLLQIKTRAEAGNLQMQAEFPELFETPDVTGSTCKRVWETPRLWPCYAVFAYVRLLARFRAGRKLRTLAGRSEWERDESSRAMAGQRVAL